MRPSTALSDLLDEYGAAQSDDPTRFFAFADRARVFCQAGCGTAEELFTWEILVFISDVLRTLGCRWLTISDAIGSLELAAYGMAEFDCVFRECSGRSNTALKAFSFFGIVTSTVEALEVLAKSTEVDDKHLKDLKRSSLWDARNNFSHVYRRNAPIEFPSLRRNEFNAERFFQNGFSYLSSGRDGYAIRSFSYERETRYLTLQIGEVFQEVRKSFNKLSPNEEA